LTVTVIRVVEVKIARELVGGGFAGEAPVLANLAVGKESDWHSSDLFRRDGTLVRMPAEQSNRAVAWLPFRVDVGVERR